TCDEKIQHLWILLFLAVLAPWRSWRNIAGGSLNGSKKDRLARNANRRAPLRVFVPPWWKGVQLVRSFVFVFEFLVFVIIVFLFFVGIVEVVVFFLFVILVFIFVVSFFIL